MSTPYSGAEDEPLTSFGPGEGHVVLTDVRLPRHGDIENVYRLSDPALSELRLEALLDELLSRVREILRVDTTAILLLDETESILVARAAKGLEAEVEQGVRIPTGAGFAGRIAEERRPIFIPDVRRAHVLNPILREQGLRSLLGVPLVDTGRVLGVMHVGTLVPRTFTSEDAAVLELAAARAAPAVSRAQLFDELEREHRLSEALQRSLLPAGLPGTAEVAVAARYLPARAEVGGDWYDVVQLGPGSFAVVVGDVAGHGARAAALMGQLRTAVRAFAVEGHGPAAVLERVNRLLVTTGPQSMATVGLGKLECETGRLQWASAGHLPPCVVWEQGRAELADTISGPPVGATPFPTYVQTELTVPEGGTVLLFTDGLVERRGESLLDGLARLQEAAAGSPEPEALCTRVLEAAGTEADDDIAAMAVQLLPIPASLALTVPADPDHLGDLRFTLRRWLRGQGADEVTIGAMVTAVGEACANVVEHAYPPAPATFRVAAERDGDDVTLTVRDTGHWREPREGNRGRGRGIMEAFMDEVDVESSSDGTVVRMRRGLAPR